MKKLATTALLILFSITSISFADDPTPTGNYLHTFTVKNDLDYPVYFGIETCPDSGCPVYKKEFPAGSQGEVPAGLSCSHSVYFYDDEKDIYSHQAAGELNLTDTSITYLISDGLYTPISTISTNSQAIRPTNAEPAELLWSRGVKPRSDIYIDDETKEQIQEQVDRPAFTVYNSLYDYISVQFKADYCYQDVDLCIHYLSDDIAWSNYGEVTVGPDCNSITANIVKSGNGPNIISDPVTMTNPNNDYCICAHKQAEISENETCSTNTTKTSCTDSNSLIPSTSKYFEGTCWRCH